VKFFETHKDHLSNRIDGCSCWGCLQDIFESIRMHWQEAPFFWGYTRLWQYVDMGGWQVLRLMLLGIGQIWFLLFLRIPYQQRREGNLDFGP